MVKHYVFDLDGTLYSERPLTNANFYKNFRPNFFLNHVLNNLNGKKYIFTNGTNEHAKNMVDTLKLKKHFTGKNTFD